VTYPRTLLLDMDDTILAFDQKAGVCWHSVCERYGDKAGCGAEALLKAIDTSREWYWSDMDRHRRGRLDMAMARREVVGHAFGSLGLPDSDLVREIAESYHSMRDALLEPFAGSLEALSAFRARGVRLGLITNGEAAMQRGKIERFKLAPYFDCILVEGEFGLGKPDERVFLHVLRELKGDPADAWMVGDNLDFDIAPAQRLGMRAIWVDHRASGLPAHTSVRPDHTIRSICELVSTDA
jgi:putative hydrolase of the HAD superfamily